MLCCSFILFIPLLTSLSRARLEAVRVGAGRQPVPRPVRHVLPLYLHINSSIDHVCVKRGEKESREVRKTPNWIHQKQQSPLPLRKQKSCWHTHTQTWHTPISSQGRTHHTYTYMHTVYRWRQIQRFTQQPSNPAPTTPKYMYTTTTTFISSAEQQVYRCRSVNTNSHFNSTYSFIHLFTHSVTDTFHIKD